MKSALEIRLAIKDNFSVLTERTRLNLEMCNILLQESLIKLSEFQHLFELGVSNNYKIILRTNLVVCPELDFIF